MPAPQVHLDLADSAELAEMLTFISQWLGGTDHAQLAASFSRFIGTPDYDLAELRTDLAASPSCSATTTAGNYSAPARTDQPAARNRPDARRRVRPWPGKVPRK